MEKELKSSPSDPLERLTRAEFYIELTTRIQERRDLLELPDPDEISDEEYADVIEEEDTDALDEYDELTTALEVIEEIYPLEELCPDWKLYEQQINSAKTPEQEIRDSQLNLF